MVAFRQWSAGALAAALASAFAGTARAEECVKDADCPGDQICEGGSCAVSQGPDQPAKPAEPPAPKYAKAGEPAPKGAVMARFESSSKDEDWRVMAGGERVCSLPCKLWVPPKSGLKLWLSGAKAEDLKVVEVPDELGYGEGEKVRIEPLSPRGNEFAGGMIGLGGSLGFLIPFVLGVIRVASKEEDPADKHYCPDAGVSQGEPGYDNADALCRMPKKTGVILTAVGGGGLAVSIGLGVFLSVWSRDVPKIDITRDRAGGDARIWLTADGIAGAF